MPSHPATELTRARALVMTHGWNAMSYQVLNPGMRRWFSAAGDGLVGYVVAAGHRVIAGSPICADARLAAVEAEFEADAGAAGHRLCYFGAEARLVRVLAARRPVATVLLGAQPTWPTAAWPEIMAGRASLRAQLARARHKDVTVEPWEAAEAMNHPELRRCLREWLATRGLPPMHFLIEWDVIARLIDQRVYVARRGQAIVGFLIAAPIPLRHGWLMEQIVRGREAPNGTNELMLDTAVRDLHKRGARFMTLGLSPLSDAAGATGSPAGPVVRLLLAWIRAHGHRFYDFQGLEQFKAKFRPVAWDPIYAVTYGSRVRLRTFYAIAGAFGGMSPLNFLGRVVARAARQELRAFGRRRAE